MPSPQAYASRGRHPLPAQVLENMSIGGSLYDEEGAKIVPEIMARPHAQSAVLPVPELCCPSRLGERGFGSGLPSAPPEERLSQGDLGGSRRRCSPPAPTPLTSRL